MHVRHGHHTNITQTSRAWQNICTAEAQGGSAPRHLPGSDHTCCGCNVSASTNCNCHIGNTNPLAESWHHGDSGTFHAARSNNHANACCGSHNACSANRPSEKGAMAPGSPHPPRRSPHAKTSSHYSSFWQQGLQGQHAMVAASTAVSVVAASRSVGLLLVLAAETVKYHGEHRHL